MGDRDASFLGQMGELDQIDAYKVVMDDTDMEKIMVEHRESQEARFMDIKVTTVNVSVNVSTFYSFI